MSSVLAAHQEFEGGGELLRPSDLMPALRRPMQEVFGIVSFPSVYQKAAALSRASHARTPSKYEYGTDDVAEWLIDKSL